MNTGKYMTLLTSKAQWTGKVLWNFEPSYRQNWNRLKKSRSFCRHDRAEVFIIIFLGRTRTGSILQRWCNSPSDCVEAFDHVCLQFLRVESLLGFEQR